LPAYVSAFIVADMAACSPSCAVALLQLPLLCMTVKCCAYNAKITLEVITLRAEPRLELPCSSGGCCYVDCCH
jgi:hypothetical protein